MILNKTFASMISVGIADSSSVMRCGLNVMLSDFPDIQVVGEAAHEESLCELIQSFQPQVILIDFAAKGFGLDTIAKCVRRHSKLRFVAVTGEQNGTTVVSALRAGITSYVKKDCDILEIADAIRDTYRGNRFFCGQILDAIRRESIDVSDLQMTEFNCEPVTISERENEVIKLIAEGYTNVEIAEKLFLSPHTVNTHRKNIMNKLGVNNTAAIVIYAVKTNLVSPNKFLFSAQAS